MDEKNICVKATGNSDYDFLFLERVESVEKAGHLIAEKAGQMIIFAAYGHTPRPGLAYFEYPVYTLPMCSFLLVDWPEEWNYYAPADCPPWPVQFWGTRFEGNRHLGLFAFPQPEPDEPSIIERGK